MACSPQNILLLTFTNKAAREMLDRVANLLPNDITGLWGGTFHSVGNRLLRRHAGGARASRRAFRSWTARTSRTCSTP